MRRLVVAAALLAVAGSATGVPVGGKLVLRRQSGNEPNLVTFTARDRGIPFPSPGTADAPTTAGMTIEIVSEEDGRATIDIPASAAWRVTPSKPRNRSYQLRGPRGLRILLREGYFRFRVENPAGLSFDAPQGAAGIRIQLASKNVCAWFDGTGVLVDRPGLFVGRRLSSRSCGPFGSATTTTTQSTTTSTTMPDDCGQRDTFMVIEKRIFQQHGCTTATCHGARASGGLDLRPGAAYDELVGVPASNVRAAAAGKTRVLPGDAAASFLSQKLHGDLEEGEGARMPLFDAPLTFIELMLVDAWIDGGAPENGVVPGAPCPPR